MHTYTIVDNILIYLSTTHSLLVLFHWYTKSRQENWVQCWLAYLSQE